MRLRSYLGAELSQRLNQHSGLDRHVKASGDTCALQDLQRTVLLADCHQAGHLILGNDDFLAAVFGEIKVS